MDDSKLFEIIFFCCSSNANSEQIFQSQFSKNFKKNIVIFILIVDAFFHYHEASWLSLNAREEECVCRFVFEQMHFFARLNEMKVTHQQTKLLFTFEKVFQMTTVFFSEYSENSKQFVNMYTELVMFSDGILYKNEVLK